MAAKKQTTKDAMFEAAEAATMADDYTPAGESAPEPERILTVNGLPISDNVRHLIPFEATDQGIEEAKERDKNKPKSMGSVTGDAWDRKMQARGDTNLETWETPDPALDVVDPIREPGMTYRLLSPRVLDKRGKRGWEIVPGATVGNMPVGKMPTVRVETRNRHYAAMANDDLNSAKERYQETTRKIIRDGKVEGLALLSTGKGSSDAFDPETGIELGVSRSRGRLGAEAA